METVEKNYSIFMEDSEDKSSKIRLMMKNLNEWVDGLPYLKGD